jgi:hypothetical protein
MAAFRFNFRQLALATGTRSRGFSGKLLQFAAVCIFDVCFCAFRPSLQARGRKIGVDKAMSTAERFVDLSDMSASVSTIAPKGIDIAIHRSMPQAAWATPTSVACFAGLRSIGVTRMFAEFKLRYWISAMKT